MSAKNVQITSAKFEEAGKIRFQLGGGHESNTQKVDDAIKTATVEQSVTAV